jgi:hypothetical protein
MTGITERSAILKSALQALIARESVQRFACLTPFARLWTQDLHLLKAAQDLGVA